MRNDFDTFRGISFFNHSLGVGAVRPVLHFVSTGIKAAAWFGLAWLMISMLAMLMVRYAKGRVDFGVLACDYKRADWGTVFSRPAGVSPFYFY